MQTAVINPSMHVNDSFLESIGFLFHHNEGYGNVFHNFSDTYIIQVLSPKEDHYFIMKDHSKLIYSGTIENQAVLESILRKAGILSNPVSKAS